MFKTKVSEKLGIQYPIVGGTMMWVTTPEFTADISNAGGLGVLPLPFTRVPTSSRRLWTAHGSYR